MSAQFPGHRKQSTIAKFQCVCVLPATFGKYIYSRYGAVMKVMSLHANTDDIDYKQTCVAGPS